MTSDKHPHNMMKPVSGTWARGLGDAVCTTLAWTHFLLPSKSLMLCVLLLPYNDDVQCGMRH